MGKHDFDNHTKGFWRTFFIWTGDWFRTPFEAQNLLTDVKIVKEECEIEKYFYQLYDERIENSKPHISFRILFTSEKGLQKFRKHLKKWLNRDSNKSWRYSFTETNYDAIQDIANAYWIGFQWLEILRKNYPDYVRSKEFLTMALHGFFNSAGYWKQEEIELALYYIGRLMGLLQELYKDKYWKG